MKYLFFFYISLITYFSFGSYYYEAKELIGIDRKCCENNCYGDEIADRILNGLNDSDIWYGYRRNYYSFPKWVHSEIVSLKIQNIEKISHPYEYCGWYEYEERCIPALITVKYHKITPSEIDDLAWKWACPENKCSNDTNACSSCKIIHNYFINNYKVSGKVDPNVVIKLKIAKELNEKWYLVGSDCFYNTYSWYNILSTQEYETELIETVDYSGFLGLQKTWTEYKEKDFKFFKLVVDKNYSW